MEWIKQIEKYNPVDEQEKKDKEIILDFINKRFASLISPTIYPCYRYGYIRCSKM